MVSLSKKQRSNLMLLLTAMIWGAAFVAQSEGGERVGAFTFNSVRMIIGGLVLLPCISWIDRCGGIKNGWKKSGKELWIGGALCGIVLFLSSALQQLGIAGTTAGKAGFITALYVVLVPLCRLFAGKRPKPLLWLCVALAAAGLYLLCVTEAFALQQGDFLVLCCAFGFTVHILLIDHFSPKVDGIRMSCIQFFVAGLLAAVPAFLFEVPSLAAIGSAAVPILYAGILSCGVAYTLQVVAQKETDPTMASLILCLESVFAVLFGWMILGEQLSLREFIGCAAMFVAIVISQFC